MNQPESYFKSALDAHTANICLLTDLLLTMELLAGLLLTDVSTTKTSEVSPRQSKMKNHQVNDAPEGILKLSTYRLQIFLVKDHYNDVETKLYLYSF